MNKQLLNNSQLASFRNCPHRWGLRYVDKLVPGSSFISPADWGTLYHLGQEVFWNALSRRESYCLTSAREAVNESVRANASLISAAVEHDTAGVLAELEEQRQDVLWALEHYVAQLPNTLPGIADGRYCVLGVEFTFEVPVKGRSLAHYGTMDLVLWDKLEDRVLVIDHKSTSNDVHAFDSRLHLDTQHVGYSYAMRKLIDGKKLVVVPGTPVAFQWHVMRRKRPSVPGVNLLTKADCILDFHQHMLTHQKATGEPMGRVSTRAIDTLPTMYEQALEQQVNERFIGLSDEQRALLARLQAKGDTYFASTETIVTEEQTQRWLTEFALEAKRIKLAIAKPEERTRNPGSCSLPGSPRCEYRNACIQPGNHYGLIDESVATLIHGSEPAEQLERDPLGF